MLEKLPRELQFKIFGGVKIQDLGALAQTNKKLRDTIIAYILSNDFSRQMTTLFTEPSPSSMRIIYWRIGFVMKRATCIIPTTKRLAVAENFYRVHGPQDLSTFKEITTSWGCLIKAFVSGWDYKECERLYKAICKFGPNDELNTLVNQFLTSDPGSNPVAERQLRTFFRGVFLEPHILQRCSEPHGEPSKYVDDDFGYYLDVILRDHSTYYQAKLVYLLLGPEFGGAVQWQLMCNQNFQRSELYVDMGQGIRSLLKLANRRKWTELQLVSLIEEVTSFPDNWTLHNYACLLDQCGDTILKIILSTRIINGRIRESCEIFACLTCISARDGLPMALRMRLFLSVLKTVKNKAEQVILITELVKTHCRHLGQVYAGVPPINFQQELSATELFYGEALRMAFLGSSSQSEP